MRILGSRYVNFIIPLLAAIALQACGGGGGGGEGVGPLNKYAGAYRLCDGGALDSLEILAIDGNTLQLNQKTTYFSNKDCSGSVVGLSSITNPITARYISTGSAKVTGYPSEASSSIFTVDRLEARVPSGTRETLVGTGVRQVGTQTCVTYSGGSVCVELGSGNIPSTPLTVGVFFTNQAIVLVDATTDGYERNWAFPR